MFGALSKSLTAKVAVQIFILMSVPFVCMTVVSSRYMIDALAEKAAADLIMIKGMKKAALIDTIRSIGNQVNWFVKDGGMSGSFNDLNDFRKAEKGGNIDDSGFKSPEYADLHKKLNNRFGDFVTMFGYTDVLLISADSGQVLYSYTDGRELGTNLESGPYRDSPLAKLWKKVASKRLVMFQDCAKYQPDESVAMFVGGPITDDKGAVLGVAAFRINLRRFNEVSLNQNIGITGETILVGEDMLMRSDSRFEKESAIMNRKVETDATNRMFKPEGVADKSETMVMNDYRGV
ncbi:MAG: hypothetical protein WC889_17690, partial [Myxococcota bacterium]